MMGQEPAHGYVDDITSNRAKGFVVISMAHLLNSISTLYGFTEATFNIFCEKEEALRYYPLDRATYTSLTKREMDLKIEIDNMKATGTTELPTPKKPLR